MPLTTHWILTISKIETLVSEFWSMNLSYDIFFRMKHHRAAKSAILRFSRCLTLLLGLLLAGTIEARVANEIEVDQYDRSLFFRCAGELSDCREELSSLEEACVTASENREGVDNTRGNLFDGALSNLFSSFTQSIRDLFANSCSNRLERCLADVVAFQCEAEPTLAPTAEPSGRPTSLEPTRGPTVVLDPTAAPSNGNPTSAPAASPTQAPIMIDPLVYTDGGNCNLFGPDPSTGIVKMKFVAFGDTPYDEEVGSPFEGPEYECLETSVLPAIRQLANEADFAVHVGDIKRGSSTYSAFCNDDVFTSRTNLFGQLEPEIDFFIIPGDNEWNECDGYDSDPDVDDNAKELWRQYFTTGDYADLDRSSIPSGENPVFTRQSGKPENFYMYYSDSNIAFFGITEPAGEREYDQINSDWIESSLSGTTVEAIVIFGHSSLPSVTRSMLSQGYPDIPTLYVKGDDHAYCMEYLDEPNVVEVTVAAFTAFSLVVTVVEDPSNGKYLFHVEDSDNGC